MTANNKSIFQKKKNLKKIFTITLKKMHCYLQLQDSGTITMMTLSCHRYLVALQKYAHLSLKETAT